MLRPSPILKIPWSQSTPCTSHPSLICTGGPVPASVIGIVASCLSSRCRSTRWRDHTPCPHASGSLPAYSCLSRTTVGSLPRDTTLDWLGTAPALSMSNPQRARTKAALGVTVMAAPISFLNHDFSNTSTCHPARRSAIPADRPAIPAPTTPACLQGCCRCSASVQCAAMQNLEVHGERCLP